MIIESQPSKHAADFMKLCIAELMERGGDINAEKLLGYAEQLNLTEPEVIAAWCVAFGTAGHDTAVEENRLRMYSKNQN